MKRLMLIVSLLSVSLVNGEGISEMWRELSRYRTVSGIKALGTLYIMYHSARSAKSAAGDFFEEASNGFYSESVSPFVTTAGMAYVTGLLFWNNLRPQVKHALALK